MALAAAAVALCGSVARADTGVIPDTPDLPWAHPTHESPLELLASRIASEIAQREVRVYCNGQNDWDVLAREANFDGARIWGYVASPRLWYPALGTFAESSTHTQLATKACERLWQFAKATTKPTKCKASRLVTETRQVSVRYRTTVAAKVRKRVKVNGRWVTRVVTVKQLVWKTRVENRTESYTEPLGLVPCYSPAAAGVTIASPAEGRQAYSDYVAAITTLAHESIHLYDFTSGRTVHGWSRAVFESRAECLGMQNAARVALALGAAPDDAANIARWYWETFYPKRQTEFPDYWSSDCRAGGPLDATPADGAWP